MRSLKAWFARLIAPLRELRALPERLTRLESAVAAHDRQLEAWGAALATTNRRLDALEAWGAALATTNRRLDALEAWGAALATANRRLDALEAWGAALATANRRLDALEIRSHEFAIRGGELAARLEPLTRLHHPDPLAFSWRIAAPDWRHRAERRIGQPLARLTAAEKRAAFYTYYSEMAGGQEAILHQQYHAYLPLFPPALQDRERSAAGREVAVVLDIGCGAGEFLAFLRARAIPALGIDPVATEVERAAARGLEVLQASAAEFLHETDRRFAAISLLQVVEHLPPEEVLPTLEACADRLAPGGLLLIETLNMRHPLAINGFYTDPTHQKPLSDNYLSFLLQWIGLEQVEILYNLPEPLAGVSADDLPRLYANYTVFGYRPAAQAATGTAN